MNPRILENGFVQERRTKVRVPMERPCRLRLLKQGASHAECNGTALNMSSNGVLVKSGTQWKPGDLVQVAIHWPAQIHPQCPLQVVLRARVVRCFDGHAAMTIERHEYRTLARGKRE